MSTLGETGAILARVQTLGLAIGVDPMPLVERATHGGLAIDRMCRVGIDGAGTALRLMAPVGSGAPDLDKLLIGLAGGVSERAIELTGSSSGVDAASIVYGKWARADVLGMAAALAQVDGEPLGHRLDLLAGRTIGLVKRARDVEVQVAIPIPDPESEARLRAVCDAIGIAPSQRDLATDLGKSFGDRSKPVMLVSLHAGAARLGVTWRATPFELIVRVLVGLGAGSGKVIGERVGSLAGAFGADAATAFELVLGGRDPIAHLDLDLVGGRLA